MATTAPTSASDEEAPPDDGPVFTFSCTCSNVRVHGRWVEDPPEGETSRRIWIGRGSEVIKHPAYIAWDTGDQRTSRSGSELKVMWRKCLVCKTRLYTGREGQIKKEEAVGDFWALIDDSSGIVYGDKIVTLSAEKPLPFSDLVLSLPRGISSFGRPPPSNPLPIYPPIPNPTSSPLPPNYLIPPVQDPFFLPPPFLPSNDHLRRMCDSAVTYLTDSHERFEADVKQYIAMRAGEMRRLEETVRNEVEVLWELYREGPGEIEKAGRSSSGSRTEEEKRGLPYPARGAQKSFVASRPVRKPPGARYTIGVGDDDPSGSQAFHGGGGGLLSASLSANTFHAPPPKEVADEVVTTINAMEKTYAKTSDARAVAMSYMFSALDDVMGKGGSTSGAGAGSIVKAQSVLDDSNQKENGGRSSPKEGILSKAKDEVINEEVVGASQAGGSEVRAKRAVTFREPSRDTPSEIEEEASETATGDAVDDDYVFDFELEEPPDEAPRERQPDIIEQDLARTYAADAPSHRSSWKNLQGGTPIISSFRRDPDNSETDLDDEPAVSKLATSVPVNITMPKKKGQSSVLPMERKTSLSDKGDVLVPSLIAAMRQRGLGESSGAAQSPTRISRFDPRHPVQQERRRSRSASISREGARSYAADPGAVFETLADEEEDTDIGGEGVGEGSLREGTFVPPHIVVRREDRQAGAEVGWRSLINE